MVRIAGHSRPLKMFAVLATFAALLGCGNTARVVVNPTSPTGPAAQPAKYAVVSAAGANQSIVGTLTQVDVFGDEITAQANSGPGPVELSLDSAGTAAYVLNLDAASDSTLNPYGLGTGLQNKFLSTTTLLAGADATFVLASGGTTNQIYIAETGRNAVAVLSGSPATLKEELPIGNSPVFLAGNASAQRIYAVANGAESNGNYYVYSIETANNTVSGRIQVGTSPVYGVVTANARRAFILNSGSANVTAIDSQANQAIATFPVGAGPVWADIDQTNSQVVTANSTGNSVSIISIPLDSFGNNGPGFGNTVTVPVGANPVCVSVLQDGTRAYVANQADGTVSVVDLLSKRLVKTIPVAGHPTSIAATTGTPRGKVYVTAPDSQVLTIINTDTDTTEFPVGQGIAINGYGVQVRVTQQ